MIIYNVTTDNGDIKTIDKKEYDKLVKQIARTKHDTEKFQAERDAAVINAESIHISYTSRIAFLSKAVHNLTEALSIAKKYVPNKTFFGSKNLDKQRIEELEKEVTT